MNTDNVIAQSIIIPNRFKFDLIESDGHYSVYHQLDGGYGQRGFDSESDARVHLQKQESYKKTYMELIARRDAIRKRMQPLKNKEAMLSTQIESLILTS